MANKKVLVLGGNFAGLTAALSVKHELGNDAEVTVVSMSDHFQFNPSLIWIPFGKRKVKDVVFPLARTFESTRSSSFTPKPRKSTRKLRRSRPPTGCAPTTTW
jgi:NADH dehydrogenase FAD-containing subunit